MSDKTGIQWTDASEWVEDLRVREVVVDQSLCYKCKSGQPCLKADRSRLVRSCIPHQRATIPFALPRTRMALVCLPHNRGCERARFRREGSGQGNVGELLI